MALEPKPARGADPSAGRAKISAPGRGKSTREAVIRRTHSLKGRTEEEMGECQEHSGEEKGDKQQEGPR